MKKNCLIISLIFLAFSSSGQSFEGVSSFGITGNQIDGDRQAGYYHVGGFASVGVQLPLTDDLSLSMQGGVVSKGVRSRNVNTKYNLLYLELPLQLHYQIDNVTIGGGLYVAYLARAKLRSGTFKIDKLDELKSNDTGVSGRVGYVFDGKNEVFVKADYSLLTIRKDIVGWYNNTLRLGVKIALN